MRFDKANKVLFLFIGITMILSCSRDTEGLEEAGFPIDGNVFLDGFSGGLNYAAFGGSDVTAFDVDTEVKYKGTASMRIAIPDVGDPRGTFAGGVYYVDGGRDLSGFNVLTFWAKASKSASIDIVGFGNDLGENKYVAAIAEVPVNTNWNKYYIPIPDPSKLVKEKGMFYYSEGAEDEKGYTIWFDDVKFENLGTIAHAQGKIYNGEDVTVLAETGTEYILNGTSTYNLPTGINLDVFTSAAYFKFESSRPEVATVDENGLVQVIDAGTTVVRGILAGEDIEGSLRIISSGDPILPKGPAPTPTIAEEDVISVFSNVYQNIPVDFYNGYWEFSTTTSDIIEVEMDEILRYKNLNFVGIQFTTPSIDVSEMTHLHLDIWTPEETSNGEAFKVLLFDLGPDGTFDGGDNASHELTFTRPTLKTEEWVSLDIPLSQFSGLTTKGNLAQIVLSGDLPTLLVDNIYFFDSGNVSTPTEPEEAAPEPQFDQANVISLFSDKYTNVSVDTWRTDWSSATLEDIQINGDAAKKYSNLDFVGAEMISNQIDASAMTHFYLDMWSPNASQIGIKLVDFGPDGMFGGGDDVEHQVDIAGPVQNSWLTLDIPLDDFTGLTNRTNIAQLILVGQPTGASTLYVDNVLFHN
jgi:hypothetical protein